MISSRNNATKFGKLINALHVLPVNANKKSAMTSQIGNLGFVRINL